MIRSVALALFIALTAVATPLPEEEVRRLEAARVYGIWSDPAEGSTYRLAGSVLRVRVPGGKFVPDNTDTGIVGAPGFVREIGGDFTAVVRVSCPTDEWDRAGKSSYLAGGLLAEDEYGNRAGVRRQIKKWDDVRVTIGCFAWKRAGGCASGNSSLLHDPPYLRLTRSGPTVRFDFSGDGVAWQEYGKYEMNWGMRLKVGVFVENTFGIPVEVTFDRYSLTQPKK
jgi:hypothetical protein